MLFCLQGLSGWPGDVAVSTAVPFVIAGAFTISVVWDSWRGGF